MSLFVKDRVFYQKLLYIAIPVSLQGIVMFGLNVTDTVMVGRLGEASIAGVALGNQFSFLYQVTCFGIAAGMGVLTAQFWGKEDRDAIRAGLSIIIRIAFVVGTIFMIAALCFPTHIMGIYSTDVAVKAEGAAYLRLLALGYLLVGLMTMSASTLRTVGVVRLMLLANCVALVLNVFFNWMFIFGNLGAPRLGTAGAALSTTICRLIEFGIVMVYLLKIDSRIRFKLHMLRKWDKEIFRNYFKNGVPVMVSDMFLGVGGNMVSVILGRMGTAVISASSITNVVLQMSAVFLMGVSNASGIITGNTIGAGEYEKAKGYGKTFLALAAIISVFTVACIQLVKNVVFQEIMIGGSPFLLFHVEESTKEVAMQLFNATSVIVVFMALSHMLTKGILRAGGDTRFLMVIDVVFLWAVSLPLGFLTGLYFKLPPYVVFFCLRSDEVIKSIWCLFRFFGGKWMRDVTIKAD